MSHGRAPAPPFDSVVLLSGGMDSAVAAAWAQAQGHRWIALSVDYGQGPSVELQAAGRVAAALGAEERLVLFVDLRAVGGSALTGGGPIPRDGAAAADGGIPATYVPARNTILLGLALAVAEARGAGAIVIGANAIDYSGYPDCRRAFLEAFGRVAETGTRAGVEGRAPVVLAPLLDLSKAGIVALGARLGVPFEATVSCYDPDAEGRACGRCDSCRLRREGFAAAGIPDPTRYVEG